MRLNKRGQDLSIGTLILIVLGIIVLVLLILGFSIGWSNLWEKINIFGGGSSIGDVVTKCNLAITTNNMFEFCEDFDKLKIEGEVEYVNCQDSRVTGSLEGSGLTCGDNTYTIKGGTDRDKTVTGGPAVIKCFKLADQLAGNDKGDMSKVKEKVNGGSCLTVIEGITLT